MSYEEIIILMNHNRPSTAIKKFATVRRWSYVFKIKFENGTVRYDLCPGFEKKWKRFSKYCLVFVGFVFMYLMMMYFGNKFLITLIKEIDSYSHGGVGVADGFSGLFTVLILFLISAMTALFSILSVMIFMSAVSSIHNAKEIVRIHNEYPHE